MAAVFLALARAKKNYETSKKGSGGTAVKANAIEYNDVPYVVTAFTQGLGLMALSEQLVR